MKELKRLIQKCYEAVEKINFKKDLKISYEDFFKKVKLKTFKTKNEELEVELEVDFKKLNELINVGIKEEVLKFDKKLNPDENKYDTIATIRKIRIRLSNDTLVFKDQVFKEFTGEFVVKLTSNLFKEKYLSVDEKVIIKIDKDKLELDFQDQFEGKILELLDLEDKDISQIDIYSLDGKVKIVNEYSYGLEEE